MKSILFLILSLLYFSGHAQPGTLDSTFGTNGLLITSPGNFGDQVNAVAIQNDQKIVFGGFVKSSFTTTDFGLYRCHANGNLDTSFGNGGLVITPIESASKINALAIRSNGQIIGGGSSQWYINLSGYLSNGTLDSSFGSGGIVITDVPGYYSETCTALAILPDGKIIVTGYGKHNSNDNPYVLLLRYLSNGVPDSSFGVNGIVVGSEGMAYSMVIQSDGKLVLGGSDNLKMALWRFLPGGMADNSFGNNGIVNTAIGFSCEGHTLGLQTDGRLVLAGRAYVDSMRCDVAIVRYLTDGNLDPTFGTAGITVTHINNSSSDVYSMDFQSDGRIVLGGKMNNASNWADYALIRLETNGSLDAGFGNNGWAITPIGTSYSVGRSLKVQTDNNIILGGYMYNGTKTNMVLARFAGNLGTAMSNIIDHEADILLYPNPFQLNTKIQFTNHELKDAEIRLLNSVGQEMSCRIDRSTMTLYRDHLSEGNYFLQFRLTNKYVVKKVTITDRP